MSTTMRVYTDESRDEIFTEDTDDKRTIPVTFFYPAQPDADDINGVYATTAESEALTAELGVPPFLNNAFHPNAYRDTAALPTDGGYPVLLFMPGLGTPPKFYGSLLEQVASHGYIVVVVDPVYSTSLSFFPDGTYVSIVPEAVNVDTDEARDALGSSWVNDASFILDTLASVNVEDETLKGMFDLAHVGMFGHSFGGAAAFQLAHDDDRVLAAINMDGSPFGTTITDGVSKPIMLMLSEEAATAATDITDEELAAAGITREEFDAGLQKQLDNRASLLANSPNGYQLMLVASKHNTYSTDTLLVRRLLPMMVTVDLVGSIEPDRALYIISDYVVAFFNKHVKGESVSLLDSPSDDYPEVVFEQLGT